ncbi:MAG: hypothetical protein RLW62_23575, partial [Gammaproteobacteria bacterium]
MTASNHPTRILTCLLAAACLAAAHAAAAVDYADGAVNTIDAPLLAGAGGARVFDGPGATTTTLNLLDGAVVNGLDAFDGSLVNIFDGATVSTDLNARDTSTVNILGGTLLNADVLDDASLTVNGGTFTGSGGRAIGAFGNAAVTITDMSVTGAPTFALLGTNSARIDLIGGAVNGEVRMEGDAAIDISGGSGIAALTATAQSTITLFGPAFSLGGLGAVSLAVPFVIDDDTWNGQLLSGTLADGSSISADIFNGISGSQIVLAA